MSVEMNLIFVLLLLASVCSFARPQLDLQEDALFALKSSLNASPNQLTNWNKNQVNPCTWSNVYCDKDSNVVQVSLAFMGLTGFLTPRIGALKSLTILSLQGNNITGDIPKEFGNLTSLVRLDLENNRLTGEIPSSLGNLKKLQFLTLSQNNLNGTIPESLGSLPNLINVLLDSNDLSGQIPKQLFNVPKFKNHGSIEHKNEYTMYYYVPKSAMVNCSLGRVRKSDKQIGAFSLNSRACSCTP